MKKVIVAAAGLMLVGTMATTAMAEFKFSGDARARFYYQDNYDEFREGKISDSDTRWNSRVRVKVEATTKGGAYMKSRIKYSDGTFGEGEKEGQFAADYAYIGVPFGPVTVEAGRMVRDITPFLFFDGRAEGVQVKYTNDNTGLVVFYDIVDENLATGTEITVTDIGVDDDGNDVIGLDADTVYNTTNDDDITRLGFLLNQSFSGGWAMNLGGYYVIDDVNEDSDGLAATAKVTGAFGDIAVEAELAYQDEEINGIDDGFGIYAGATIPVGPASVYAMAGATFDGYQWDAADFGPFAIFNDYSQIATGPNLSAEGETLFLVVNPTFKASEKLTLGAVASIIDIDAYDPEASDATVWEIGATASYAVTDGAKLNGIIAYGDTDDLTEDDPFGVGLSLEISF
ncbi:porin [Desulfosediminicola ganghwensis]|uniref:porin n=1 Tax=Desulfosediminicola ganghwensis TaxID=2569540 RepID=UPI0010AB8002|nr:porin [Desulfosediminicola ganghwensis]